MLPFEQLVAQRHDPARLVADTQDEHADAHVFGERDALKVGPRQLAVNRELARIVEPLLEQFVGFQRIG
jgi:hypothetical protein